jgi:UDP-2,3-diacylglucosamine pyrophosphatase LpxH
LRRIADDTMLVFLSDTHIGGDPGVNIFESPQELATLFEEMSQREGPVEMVLAGDAFDFLRISDPGAEENRASEIVRRPEYQSLFDAWRRFAGREDCNVVYLPGNHDAEAWWNAEVQKTLRAEGLVSEFALSYAATFESRPDRTIYCEHGNQFDPTNAIADYNDPRDTPLGDPSAGTFTSARRATSFPSFPCRRG